jgi:hypothetical protein
LTLEQSFSARNALSAIYDNADLEVGTHSTPEHGEDVVSDKFLSQIVDEDFLDPHLLCLAPHRSQLLPLSQCHKITKFGQSSVS